MKNAQAALALATGYLLGRSHKGRLALALAGMAAGRRLRAAGGGHGAELLKSPEVNRLVEDVRGQLFDAGRAAAVHAAGRRIDSLSDRLEQRTAALRSVPGAGEVADAVPTKPKAAKDEPEEEGPKRARPARERPDDEERERRPARKRAAPRESAETGTRRPTRSGGSSTSRKPAGRPPGASGRPERQSRGDDV